MKLAHLLRRYRYAEELTLGELAAQIGVEESVLGRFEREGTTSGKTLATILAWALQPVPDVAPATKGEPGLYTLDTPSPN